MTYEEAIAKNMMYQYMIQEVRNHKATYDYNFSEEECDFLIDVLEKADKYRWHDLRKDPTDLPTKRDWVLAVFKEPDCDFVLVPRVADYVGYETSATTEEFWLIAEVCAEDMSEYYKSLKCIAWKEIEPFEEVDE